ncbi:hypothetical protein N0V94_008732 [Neodidymelliopsis sp. IMI 364377]|nr:hypothetical protein N0V94_008732 [Neodidymelliopsis sp. IMI 364377]
MVRVEVRPEKAYMDFGFYSGSFRFADASYSTPGGQFSDGAEPGPYPDTNGILMYNEIMALLQEDPGLKLLCKKAAEVKYRDSSMLALAAGTPSTVTFDLTRQNGQIC